MITYVNTVLVSNLASSNVLSAAPAGSNQDVPSADAGKFVFMTLDEDFAAKGLATPYDVTAANAGDLERIKVGIVTKENAPKVNYTTGALTYEPVIKWSNVISADSVKSYLCSKYSAANATTEDAIVIDFTNLATDIEAKFAQGGKRLIVRLTFKDLPTRFRKWTESYEYVTKEGDTAATIAQNIANQINFEWKRARVSANGAASKVVLTALPYDDDESNDTLNWANKVRFNANIYYTDPAADGWESKNKHFPTGVTVDKVPGKQYEASAKLVRDRESQAMGYLGILNRGEGTWPIIKPAMETDINAQYDALTLEFENMYRAADDIFRKTKQTLEVYGLTGQLASLKTILDAFVA